MVPRGNLLLGEWEPLEVGHSGENITDDRKLSFREQVGYVLCKMVSFREDLHSYGK